MPRTNLRSICARLALLAAACVCSAPGPALAQPRGGADLGINLDINAFGTPGNDWVGPPTAAFGAASGQTGFWNNYTLVSGPLALNGLTGAPAGVTLTRVDGGGPMTGNPPGVPTADFARLMHDWDHAVAGVVNFVEYHFDGLVPGSYTVYTYAGRPAPINPFQIEIWVENTFIGENIITGGMVSETFTAGLSHVSRNVTVGAGQTLRVIANDNSGEFGDEVSIAGIQLVRFGDPVAAITGPANLACACDPVTITGTATASGFAGWTLEYSQTGGDPWTTIATGDIQVTNNTLAVWDTTGLAEGYYFIRLTVQSTNGISSTAVRVVYVTQGMNSVVLNSPANNQVLGGSVCFDGIVWDECGSTYTLEFRTNPPGVYAPVDPANPTYPGQIINLFLGLWDTDTGPTASPDGLYDVRVRGTNSCGERAEQIRTIIVDNTAPIAIISSPPDCANARGIVPIIGTASDANLNGWVVQYADPITNNWVNIASGNTNVNNALLANWDTTGLTNCCHLIRLIVTDRAAIDCTPFSHQTEYLVAVDIGCPGDFNNNGVVSSQDLFDFLAAFFSVCP